jgi:hypothetical protein
MSSKNRCVFLLRAGALGQALSAILFAKLGRTQSLNDSCMLFTPLLSTHGELRDAIVS